MKFYYNGRKLVKVPEDWSEEMRAAQIELLTAQDFRPVVNMEDEVANDIPFALRKPVFRLNEAGTAYTVTIRERYLPVHLSQEKLVAHEAIASKLPALMCALQADAELQAWWGNNMNYVRESAVAKKAMAAFGLSQEAMEKIALECMK